MSGYTVTLHAYCGMAQPMGQVGMDQGEARRVAARLIRRRRRQDFPVTLHQRGREWEIEEPDDCMLVPDCCGMLILRKPDEEVPL